MRTNPGFAGAYEFDDAANFPALFPGFLDRLPDGSVVMCHPGFVDAELQRLDPLTTLREREYAFLAGDAFPAVLASHGVALAGTPSTPLSALTAQGQAEPDNFCWRGSFRCHGGCLHD